MITHSLSLFCSLPSLLKLSNTLFKEWDTVSIGFMEWFILLPKLIGHLSTQSVSGLRCVTLSLLDMHLQGEKKTNAVSGQRVFRPSDVIK